ncbi:MAG: hypothetical protein BWY74_03414 [Firmicutes bacterium ADurb.Bin419]|nr:MAG: hypothetical protein BWY74_03414 [Firmicutes bacterium ADurb.Bin419]
MKIRYYFNIAILIAVSAFLLSSCGQNSAEKASALPTSTTNTPVSTGSDAEAETNYIERLKSEGYSSEEIETSQSYVSRVVLQLNEIETFGSIYAQPAGIESVNTDDTSKYPELLSKIDEQKSVYYLAKLNRVFNSMEDAFNEYLFSLQSDLDIEGYFMDREKYTEEKNEKMSTINSDEFITTRNIEEKALEKLQNMNNSGKSPDQSLPGINNPNRNLLPDYINPQPDLPKVEIPQPIDPSQEIKNKLGPQF